MSRRSRDRNASPAPIARPFAYGTLAALSVLVAPLTIPRWRAGAANELPDRHASALRGALHTVGQQIQIGRRDRALDQPKEAPAPPYARAPPVAPPAPRDHQAKAFHSFAAHQHSRGSRRDRTASAQRADHRHHPIGRTRATAPPPRRENDGHPHDPKTPGTPHAHPPPSPRSPASNAARRPATHDDHARAAQVPRNASRPAPGRVPLDPASCAPRARTVGAISGHEAHHTTSMRSPRRADHSWAAHRGHQRQRRICTRRLHHPILPRYRL